MDGGLVVQSNDQMTKDSFPQIMSKWELNPHLPHPQKNHKDNKSSKTMSKSKSTIQLMDVIG